MVFLALLSLFYTIHLKKKEKKWEPELARTISFRNVQTKSQIAASVVVLRANSSVVTQSSKSTKLLLKPVGADPPLTPCPWSVRSNIQLYGIHGSLCPDYKLYKKKRFCQECRIITALTLGFPHRLLLRLWFQDVLQDLWNNSETRCA